MAAGSSYWVGGSRFTSFLIIYNKQNLNRERPIPRGNINAHDVELMLKPQRRHKKMKNYNAMYSISITGKAVLINIYKHYIKQWICEKKTSLKLEKQRKNKRQN